jgi:hypothetical protein
MSWPHRETDLYKLDAAATSVHDMTCKLRFVNEQLQNVGEFEVANAQASINAAIRELIEAHDSIEEAIELEYRKQADPSTSKEVK